MIRDNKFFVKKYDEDENKITLEEERKYHSPFVLFLIKNGRLLLAISLLLSVSVFIIAITLIFGNMKESSIVMYEQNGVVVSFDGDDNSIVNGTPITKEYAEKVFDSNLIQDNNLRGVVIKLKEVSIKNATITFYSDRTAIVKYDDGSYKRIYSVNGNYGITESGVIDSKAITNDLSGEYKKNDKYNINLIYLSDGSVIVIKDKVELFVRNSDITSNDDEFFTTLSGVSTPISKKGNKYTYSDGTIKEKDYIIVDDIKYAKVDEKKTKDNIKIIYYDNGYAEIIYNNLNVMVKNSEHIRYNDNIFEIIDNDKKDVIEIKDIMDIKLQKKPWYIRYRYYLAGGILFLAFIIYVIILSAGPSKLRIDQENVQIAEVKNDKFMEYVDVEGLIQPILTIIVNARESGSVDRIVGEEGSLLQKGDTILVLENPDLIHNIEEQRDDLEKQLISFREKEIEMEQKSLTLQQQTLQTNYELARLQKSFNLDKEEYKMGIKSKAQLEVAEDEYNYNVKKAKLQRESLRQDSVVAIIRKDLIHNDRERERKKYERACERLDNLVIKAPVAGQLSFVKVTPGQQVSSNQGIAEIKVLDQYKIHTSLSEYYIDRITTGLPATINYQGRKYPLRITKVVPEVKDRTFDVDLVFTGEMPDNVRVGKSFRVQIELGQPEQAIVIPSGNFYQATGGQWIYKLNASKTKAIRVPLSIGRQNPQQYEITDGLQPGDWVITTGYDNFGEAEELILK